MEENKESEIERKPEQKQKISTPQAIIVAGVLIMIGVLLTRSAPQAKTAPTQTLSEQVGVSKDALNSCIKNTDLDALNKNITDSVDKALKNVPSNQRGTPYSVVIGKNGVKTDMKGAYTYQDAKKVIDDAMTGKVATSYTGDVPPPNATDHILGSLSAPVIIIEYSDFECPYCKAFHPVLKQIVSESNGNVAWIYRHWPLHQHSFEKLVAAECISKIKGNDAFWKYGDLLFGMLKTAPDSVSDQL